MTNVSISLATIVGGAPAATAKNQHFSRMPPIGRNSHTRRRFNPTASQSGISQTPQMTEKHHSGRKSLRKGRYSQRGGIYFVTSVTEGRHPWFLDFSLGCIMSRTLDQIGKDLSIEILCWVVMPDHMHLLVDIAENDLSRTVGKIKSHSAKRLNRQIGRRGKFWADGFYDHGLRKTEDLRSIARYIVGNPLRARLAARVGDYPFWNAKWL